MGMDSTRVEDNMRFSRKNAKSDPLPVVGIREMLLFAIQEVLTNALTFAPANSTITLDLRQYDQSVVLTVQDTGPGIPPEDLEQVWEPLTQAKREEQEQQGAGMGLAIVRRICELHGGHATLESILEQGTTVLLSLPRAEHA